MSDVKIVIDDKELRDLAIKLKELGSKDLPYIVKTALNKTASRTLQKVKREIPRFIDRPTPFTVNSLTVVPATKTKLEAVVQWRDFNGRDFGAGRPLEVQAEGGPRKDKGLDSALISGGYMFKGYQAVPSGAPRDAYGNVPGGFITKIISYLRADRSGTQNRPGDKLNRRQQLNQTRKQVKVFAVNNGIVVGTGQPTKLHAGVYQRIASAFGNGYKQLFHFVRGVTYRKRFPIKEIVETYTQAVLKEELDNAIRLAAKTRANFTENKG